MNLGYTSGDSAVSLSAVVTDATSIAMINLFGDGDHRARQA